MSEKIHGLNVLKFLMTVWEWMGFGGKFVKETCLECVGGCLCGVCKVSRLLELVLAYCSKRCISLKFIGLFHFEDELWSWLKGG